MTSAINVAAKKPKNHAAAGEEVLLVAGVLAEVGGKEQGAEEEVEHCVEDDEEVVREVPLLDEREAELPPPEMDDPEEQRDGPAEVKERGLFAAGVLDEAGESAEQCGDAQADDDGDDDADVLVEIGVRLLDGHAITMSCAMGRTGG